MVTITSSSGVTSIVETHSKIVQIKHTDFEGMLNKISGIETGRVAIICNTVNAARNIYNNIKVLLPETDLTLFHSRYVISHRMKLTDIILEKYGKTQNAESDTQLQIVIGTQVLEQSLDIDFDLMFTENAPIDLVLQRAGRLHRHPVRNRPVKLETPQLYILEDESMLPSWGSKYIYGEYLLDATLHVLSLKPSISIPDDIGALIEGVYSPAFTNNEDGLQEQHKTYLNAVKGSAAKAQPFNIITPIGLRNLYGWLDKGASTDVAGEAKVRDGVSGPEVILLDTDSSGNLCYYNGKGKLTPLPSHEPNFHESLEIKNSTVMLPIYFGSEDFITKLEEECHLAGILELWDNGLLKGELPIILKNGKKDTPFGTIYYSEAQIGRAHV